MDMNAGAEAARAVSADGNALPAGVKKIVGTTILMGDGAYFDYEDPAGSVAGVTHEDVAFGLAFTSRFRGQTRFRNGRRVYYSVAEHCVRMAMQLLLDEHGRANALAGLLHELGEVPCGDMPAPMKIICPEFKVIEKRCEAALAARFGLTMPDPALIKTYDIRMLRTEKRELMPQSGRDEWATEDCESIDLYPPFPFTISPWSPERAAKEFLTLWEALA